MTYYNVKELLQFLNENEKMKGIDKHILDLFIDYLNEYEDNIISDNDLSDLVQEVDQESIGEGNLIYFPDIEKDFYRIRKLLSVEGISEVEQQVNDLYYDNPRGHAFDLMFCLSYYYMQFHEAINLMSEISQEEESTGLVIDFSDAVEEED